MAFLKSKSLANSRLKGANRVYEAAHAAAHAHFRAAYNAALARHGVSMGTVMTKSGQTITDLLPHFEHPEAFHADEELAAAREAFHASMKVAHEARQGALASLPKARR